MKFDEIIFSTNHILRERENEYKVEVTKKLYLNFWTKRLKPFESLHTGTVDVAWSETEVSMTLLVVQVAQDKTEPQSSAVVGLRAM